MAPTTCTCLTVLYALARGQQQLGRPSSYSEMQGHVNWEYLQHSGSCSVPDRVKRDCGTVHTDEESCQNQGCCWAPEGQIGPPEGGPEGQKKVHAPHRPYGGGVPWCFLPESAPNCVLRHHSDPNSPPFSGTDISTLRQHLAANIDINGTGAVVASADQNVTSVGPFVHSWPRDAALAMDTVRVTMNDYRAAKDFDVEGKLKRYVEWTEKAIHEDAPVEVRTTESFFLSDSEFASYPYDYASSEKPKPVTPVWCRPQTDGPGLMAMTLAKYALQLLAEQQISDASIVRKQAADLAFVKKYLWTGDDSVKNGGLVKYALDYLMGDWTQEECFQSGNVFWNKYVSRAGLHYGAKLARKMGDYHSASRYNSAAKDIEDTFKDHISSVSGYVFDAFELAGPKKDAKVVEAFNIGDLGDGVFAPLSKEVIKTVIALNGLFCSEFEINLKDSRAGIPGILYGSYDGDVYNGGNPWVLLSAALAELIYRQAAAALASDGVSLKTYSLLQKAYSIPDDLTPKALADALFGVGDGVLLRIKHHIPKDLRLDEQIDRESGEMSSAKSFSWSYANVLKAMHFREEYLQKAAHGSSSADDESESIYSHPRSFDEFIAHEYMHTGRDNSAHTQYHNFMVNFEHEPDYLRASKSDLPEFV